MRTVNQFRRWASASLAGAIALLAVTVGLPAYGQVAAQLQTQAQSDSLAISKLAAPPPQVMTVTPTAPEQVVVRDAYTVTAPPALAWPVAMNSQVSSDFGPRVSPCYGCSSYHQGVDLTPGEGTVIHSMAKGTVIEAETSAYNSLGVHVVIRHTIDGQRVDSAYGHMQLGSMPVRVGDIVATGQPIGRVGSTGDSTGPHLHLEIRLGGTDKVDPMAWLHARLG